MNIFNVLLHDPLTMVIGVTFIVLLIVVAFMNWANSREVRRIEKRIERRNRR
jgi:hypothetical protein